MTRQFTHGLLTISSPKGGYSYDPMYHGPSCYYVLTTGCLRCFGDTDLVARFLPRSSALLVPLVYAIYRLGIPRPAADPCRGALHCAVSPSLVYFSRFLRHDIFQLFFTLLILVALLAYLNRGRLRYAVLAGIAVGGGMTFKEDMPIFLLILAGFALFLLRTGVSVPGHWKRDTILGLLLAVAIMALLYSSFGSHFEVLQTGWIRAFQHWTAMHGQCRICGPSFFYILLFLLYEVPIFILAVAGTVQFASRHLQVPSWLAIRRRTGTSVTTGETGRKQPAPGPW